MKLPRRQFLHLAASAAALPFAPHVARAQAYPSRPVRIIVGFPAGWLAFAGRESNPLDRYKRFLITSSSSFPGLLLAQ